MRVGANQERRTRDSTIRWPGAGVEGRIIVVETTERLLAAKRRPACRAYRSLPDGQAAWRNPSCRDTRRASSDEGPARHEATPRESRRERCHDSIPSDLSIHVPLGSESRTSALSGPVWNIAVGLGTKSRCVSVVPVGVWGKTSCQSSGDS